MGLFLVAQIATLLLQGLLMNRIVFVTLDILEVMETALYALLAIFVLTIRRKNRDAQKELTADLVLSYTPCAQIIATHRQVDLLIFPTVYAMKDIMGQMEIVLNVELVFIVRDLWNLKLFALRISIVQRALPIQLPVESLAIRQPMAQV